VKGTVELSPGDWAVLGAVGEGPTHGFALAALLGPDGALGRVWTLPRPSVYQALKKLERLGLVAQRSMERSDRGPSRTVVSLTPKGRRTLARWLEQPVDHVRDVRSLLLLKLALLDRSGADPRPLLESQRARMDELLEALKRQRSTAKGFDRVLADWRLASAQATLRFLDMVVNT
jgi:DNA-binding PadR family transcriptional regulator